MPALPPYVPVKDSAFANWLANFNSLLTAAPATYGQTAGTASAVSAVAGLFAAAYALVTSPSTKTADTVQAKNTAKVNALAVVRPVAQNISLNPGVTSANKIAIGVNPRTSTPQPITVPTTYPSLSVQGGAALQLYVRYRDSSASPSVKAKPYGVAVVILRYATSATAIVDPALLVQALPLTKSPALVQFGASDGGKQCYMAAYYVLKNGKVGAFGGIVSFTVPQST